jgi:hypothetical protein
MAMPKAASVQVASRRPCHAITEANRRVTGRPLHHTRRRRLQRKGERGKQVGDQVQPENLQHRQRQRPPKHDRAEDREQFGEVAGKEIVNEAQDVGDDHAALFHSADDRHEPIVGDDDVGGFLGGIGPAQTHGDANVGRLERRRIVDAIAGHGHDIPAPLERVDDLQLVLWRHAREDRRLGRNPFPCGVVESRQLSGMHRAIRRPVVRVIDAKLPRDLAGGRDLVAGDHHHPDSGATTLGDRLGDAVTDRIDHPHQSDERQVVRHGMHRLLVIGIQHAEAQAQHTEGPCGEAVIAGEPRGAASLGEGDATSSRQLPVAGAEDR